MFILVLLACKCKVSYFHLMRPESDLAIPECMRDFSPVYTVIEPIQSVSHISKILELGHI